MKKKYLALIIGASLASGGTSALADVEVGGVTIYGKLHLSADSLNADSKDRVIDVEEDENGDPVPIYGTDSSTYLSSNSSRLGFKGTHDLNESTKVVWQIESSVNIADGGGTIAGRNSYLGVAGNFGTFLGGRHDTPFKIIGRKVDFFGDQIGDARNLTRQKEHGALGFDERVSNVIAWASPTWSGVNLLLAYVAEDGTENADAVSGNVTWKNKSIMLGAAYESHGKALNGGEDKSNGVRVVGSFKIASFKINALYQQLKDVGGSGGDVDSYGLGASYTMAGKHVIKAQYYIADDYGDAKDSSANMGAVGYDYKWDKTTTVYAAYAQTSNDDNANYSAFAGGHGEQPDIGPGASPSGFSLGAIYKF